RIACERRTSANLWDANTAAGWPRFARIPRAYARTGIRSKGCETRRLGQSEPVKYWELIADRLHAAGWSYGIAEHSTKHGLLFCVDAHRDGKRFIVKADDLLTAFLSLERDVIAPKGANGNATRQNVTYEFSFIRRRRSIRARCCRSPRGIAKPRRLY